MLKPSFARFNASQLNNRHSVFQSVKKVSVTSFKILDIPRCALRWAAQSLTVDHRTERKAISSELLASFEADRETSYPRLLQEMIPGSIILHRRQKHNQWNGTIHKLPEEQIKKAFIRGQGYDYGLLGL
jgi:hypothetical protein